MPDHERSVTEADFRRPEFRDADPKDYEFRHDGEIVRRDRWENAVQSIRHLVGIGGREFEIPDVVEAVRRLAGGDADWCSTAHLDPSDTDLKDGSLHVLRLGDGSILRNAVWTKSDEGDGWMWRGHPATDVASFRDEDPEPDPATSLLGREPVILWNSETVRDGTRTRLTLAIDVVRLVLVRVEGDRAWKDAEAALLMSKTFDEMSNATVRRPVLDEAGTGSWERFRSEWEPIEEASFHLAAAFDLEDRFFVALANGRSGTEVLLARLEDRDGSLSSSIVARIGADELKGRRR